MRSETHLKEYANWRVNCEGVYSAASDHQQTVCNPSSESRSAQPRSSVLRLHPNLLHQEDKHSYPSERNLYGDGVCKTRGIMMKTRSKVYTNDESLKNTADIENEKQANNFELPLSTESHFTPMLDCKDTFKSLFDGTDLAGETFCDLTSPDLLAAWQPGDWSEPYTFDLSTLSPPITARPPTLSISLDVPPFETFYDTLPSESAFPIDDTKLFEDLVSGKRMKRELPKKCRKVYGIENKKAWCTQCRWKKACTRFNS